MEAIQSTHRGAAGVVGMPHRLRSEMIALQQPDEPRRREAGMLEHEFRALSRIATGRPRCEMCDRGAGHRRYVGEDGRWHAQAPGAGTLEHRFCDKHLPPEGSLSLDLRGDRDIEWSYVAACAGRYAGPGTRVLDFGAGSGSSLRGSQQRCACACDRPHAFDLRTELSFDRVSASQRL